MTHSMPRHAWIVGAGSGLGRASALALAAQRFRLTLSGTRPGPLEQTRESVSQLGVEADVRPLDVNEAAAVLELGQSFGRSAPPLDLLVYSAGFNVVSRKWQNVSMSDFTSIVDTNLTGAARCTSAVLTDMRNRSGGLVVIVSSWSAWRFLELAGPGYAASKAGLGALVESINAEEGANGIRATHLCPGEVDTPILKARPVPPSPDDLARMLQPDDVGSIVAMLANLPASVCINELVMSHPRNRFYP